MTRYLYDAASKFFELPGLSGLGLEVFIQKIAK